MEGSFTTEVWWVSGTGDQHAQCEVFYDEQGPYKIMAPGGDVLGLLTQFALDLIDEQIRDQRFGATVYAREIVRDQG